MRGGPESSASSPRLAVLGTGRWGINIVRELVGLDVTVIAVDPDEAARARATEIGAAEQCAALGDDHAVDAVVVATPASDHEQHVGSVAALGVPIACEKPLATTVAAAERIVESVGDRLTVLHVWRYHPAVVLLGELARSGRLGGINAVHTVRTNWTSPRLDVDPVWTLMPHDLSVAIEILGHLPDLERATVERIRGRAVGIWATYGIDPAVIVEASSRGERRRRITVHGTDAVAVFDESNAYVQILSGDGVSPDEDRITYDPTPALRIEMDAFVRHVRGGPPPRTDAHEALTVVRGVDHALRAAGAEPRPSRLLEQ